MDDGALGHAGPVRAPDADGSSRVAHAAAATTEAIAEANADIPDLRLTEIRRAAEDILRRILRELAGESVDTGLSDDQQEIVRDTAARGKPFSRIVRALRLAQRQWIALLLDDLELRCHADPARVADVVTGQIDAVVDASVSSYLQEQERMLVGAEARRRDLVEALVAGQKRDPSVCRATLGLDLDDHHLAMVVRHTGPGARSGSELRRTAERAAQAAGGRHALIHEATSGSVWLWASSPRALDLTAMSHIDNVAIRAGHRVAAGSVRPGVAGFRRSHREALTADRLPDPDDGGPATVSYADVALAVMLAADLEQARWFVADRLGGLAAATGQASEQRETLSRFYEANQSLVGAAGPLHVHRNTVVYRLQRIERLLGRPVDDGAAENRCALLLAEHFGDAVLAEPE